MDKIKSYAIAFLAGISAVFYVLFSVQSARSDKLKKQKEIAEKAAAVKEKVAHAAEEQAKVAIKQVDSEPARVEDALKDIDLTDLDDFNGQL